MPVALAMTLMCIFIGEPALTSAERKQWVVFAEIVSVLSKLLIILGSLGTTGFFLCFCV